ncbi:MAG: type pantothenate kinase [Herminiimonas sp.]|nr:type pantothenate kinase [Herminiimonas sp.]
MLLLVDAGNTRIKWALTEKDPGAHAPGRANALGRWIASGAVARADSGLLADAWHGLKIARILLSNVAGEPMHKELEQILLRVLGLQLVPVEWFKSVAALGGVRNGYRDPAQLGCDRFASAIGAHALFPGRSLIVVTCGTATTIDAVTADGLFMGGMILPGPELMAASLAGNTAQLPQVAQHAEAAAIFADNTDDAIASGCIAAQAGAIERAVAARIRQHGAVQCIISGGAATMVAPHLSIPCDKVDNLVLIGLQTVVMQQNQKEPC